MYIDLFFKTSRHDRSITEFEKKQFRTSKEWLEHRQRVYDFQNGLDYITHEPLKDDWNCHHICMVNDEYKNLNNPFVDLNKDTHAKVHETFSKYFDDKDSWNEFKKKYGNSPSMIRFYKVLELMFEMNDDIEPVLYCNNYDYRVIEPGDKYNNKLIAERVGYPVNSKGYLQWNHNYIPSKYPEETAAWFEYMKTINAESDYLTILELRHMNLYSSYKNFRNNPKIRIETKRACRKELETVTKLLRNFI